MNYSLDTKRHSLAHIMAQGVQQNFPETKCATGPFTDDGFYYDFDFGTQEFSDKDLKKIEKSMKKIISQNQDFKMFEVSYEQARELLKIMGEDFKSGPEDVLSTSSLDANSFKLARVAWAYWMGNADNQQLTRIYAYAFDDKEQLDIHLKMLEEAKKRDHRIIGAKLKLFSVSELIGPGLPLMQPAGMIIRQELEDYLWSLHKDRGYDRVWTPHIAKEALYETSGHAAKFGDELFRVQGKEDRFIMKPMNCPHHMQIFADNQFSYRDMPVRYFEPATIYRDEKSGQLSGLTRVRAITQDDW